MNIAIITGASSGIGREFALAIDRIFSNLDEIWLIARRTERMEELSRSLFTKTRIFTMDLSNEESIRRFRGELKRMDSVVRILVNCAGFGYIGRFADISLREQADMIAINCAALTKLTYCCIPYMKKNSRIIQLASSAAFLPQPGFAVYSATKSYVLSFSRALSEELRKDKIYVTAVCPGPVDTEFFCKAEKYGRTMSVKKLTMVTAQRVVKEAIRASYRKKTISVCSLPIKMFHSMTKLLPHGPILRLLGGLRS